MSSFFSRILAKAKECFILYSKYSLIIKIEKVLFKGDTTYSLSEKLNALHCLAITNTHKMKLYSWFKSIFKVFSSFPMYQMFNWFFNFLVFQELTQGLTWWRLHRNLLNFMMNPILHYSLRSKFSIPSVVSNYMSLYEKIRMLIYYEKD